MNRSRRTAAIAAALAVAALVLSACSPAAEQDGSGGKTTVTFRLWDEKAASAYKASFKKFTEKNPGIDVRVEVVPWEQYWKRLPLDVSSGDMADVYWTNSSNFAQYADSGDIMDAGQAVGADHDEWQKPVVDLYTRKGKLWGVPQLWDSIGLYYNKSLVGAAGVDVRSLAWAPHGGQGDTLLSATRKLTVDAAGRHPGEAGFDASHTKVYGFNAQADMQAVYLPFLAEAGADYQSPSGQFAFASSAGEDAIGYLVDMISKHRVAPPAADTNTSADATRDLFVQGKLALYQSGPYNLKTIAESAKGVDWGLAPLVARRAACPRCTASPPWAMRRRSTRRRRPKSSHGSAPGRGNCPWPNRGSPSPGW